MHSRRESAVGVELDSGLVAAARAAAAAEGLDCCSFEETTVLEVAPASDTRLVAYLLPAGLSKVAARLKAAGFCGLFFTIRWAVSQSATMSSTCTAVPSGFGFMLSEPCPVTDWEELAAAALPAQTDPA